TLRLCGCRVITGAWASRPSPATQIHQAAIARARDPHFKIEAGLLFVTQSACRYSFPMTFPFLAPQDNQIGKKINANREDSPSIGKARPKTERKEVWCRGCSALVSLHSIARAMLFHQKSCSSGRSQVNRLSEVLICNVRPPTTPSFAAGNSRIFACATTLAANWGATEITTRDCASPNS